MNTILNLISVVQCFACDVKEAHNFRTGAFRSKTIIKSKRCPLKLEGPYFAVYPKRELTGITGLEVCNSCAVMSCTFLSLQLQETYLMKHMRKHNPDPLTVAATLAAQQAQGLTPGGGRGRGRGRGTGGAGRVDQLHSQNPNSQNPNPGAPGIYEQSQQPPEAVVQCPFDLHQYKTVSASEIQYKPVSVADLPVAHKDLCLTVSTSAIQVEHMNS